jgi:hypothetical protein
LKEAGRNPDSLIRLSPDTVEQTASQTAKRSGTSAIAWNYRDLAAFGENEVSLKAD